MKLDAKKEGNPIQDFHFRHIARIGNDSKSRTEERKHTSKQAVRLSPTTVPGSESSDRNAIVCAADAADRGVLCNL